MKLRAFTLVEAVVASLIFLIILGVISQIVISLMRASFQINEFHAALENLRLGLEKIWRELTYGSEFIFNQNSIEFKDRNCLETKLIFQQDGSLVFRKNETITEIFDPNFVKIKNLIVDHDAPSGGELYFQKAYKIINLSLQAELRSKINSITMDLQLAVAPLNSVFPAPPCRNQ